MCNNITGTKDIVEGLWLDGKWFNVSWVAPSYGIPGHWREGVYIERSFVNGALSSVAMDVNGSWVDVTSRVKLLEKDTIMPMSDTTIMLGVFAREEIRFYNPRQWNPIEELPLYTVNNVNLDDGFNNGFEPGKSRLIMFTGTLAIFPKSTPDIVAWLNSNRTIVEILAQTIFQDPVFNGVYANTGCLARAYQTINLTTVEKVEYTIMLWQATRCSSLTLLGLKPS
jgi:hypothetical protein